jgi:hypothetical protein
MPRSVKCIDINTKKLTPVIKPIEKLTIETVIEVPIPK